MMTTESTSAYTTRFWAKAHPYGAQGPEHIHLLEHHLADVGACFEALLAQPAIRLRLAQSGGGEELDGATIARLSLIAAMHDLGKVNIGFQAQVWRNADHSAGPKPPQRAGHVADLTPVLNGSDRETAKWFFDALGWWKEATDNWDDAGGETFYALFTAALSHHGRPVQLEGEWSANPRIWRAYGNLDPREQVRRIGALAKEWFRDAFTSDAPRLPSAPAFQHMFLGLCTLADWMGSNDKAWFPYCDEPRDDYISVARKQAHDAVKAIGLDLAEQRGRFAKIPGFETLFSGYAPKAVQQAAWNTPLDERIVIIESETGSGKTEAALWRFARMYEQELVDGLYFALPTRAAAVQLHERVEAFVERMFVEERPPVVLAVPGYDTGADAAPAALPEPNAEYHEHDRAERPWASERPKRYLAAQIAVGSIDQAMMGALKVRHAHLRAACLARNLLVVDEVHASDAYMSRIIKALLDAHREAGGYALLMSATLGSVARRQWLSVGRTRPSDAPPLDEAIDAPYPAVSVLSRGRDTPAKVGGNAEEKTVHVEAQPLIGNFGAAARLALEAARNGAKALVVRNTVASALSTQQALEAEASEADRARLFALNGTTAPHHGRFAQGDRRLLDGEIEARLGKERRESGGLVVVGTQTLEQSLDIDADLLITDLCPMDVLLQRIGRLHRHERGGRPAGYQTPRCIVLTPESADLSPLLEKGGVNRHGLGPQGKVYEDVRVLEATRRLITEHPEWRIPAMNRELVERATHPEALKAIVKQMGDKWREHANSVEGGELADGLTAGSAIIKRNLSFFTDNLDVLFGSAEERIRTRLGDEGIDVELAPPQRSPFEGAPSIARLSVPARWLSGERVEGAVTAEPAPEGGFTFAVGERRFHYDRLGLRKAG